MARSLRNQDDAQQPRLPLKSESAYRTISEVAADMEIPPHVLRFWETKFRQIQPVKRAGGRRYYRPQDIEVLNTIQDLLYNKGFTIKGAQKHLREKNKEKALSVSDLKTLLQQTLEELRTLRESLSAR